MACDPGGTQEPHRLLLLVDATVQAPRRRRLPAASHGDGTVVMLRRQAPTGDEQQVGILSPATAEGCSCGGSFSKEALGRLCTCNGLLLLDQDQEEILLHLTGPVEHIQIQGRHGITASLLQTYMAAGFNFGALDIAPVNPRIPVKWPLGTSVDDLLSSLQGCSCGGSFSKEALGRLCTCNGLLLLDLDQEDMLLHLTGPGEHIQIQGRHGITASLLQTYMAAGFNFCVLDITPVNTRVPIKWPLDTSVDIMSSLLQVRDMNTTEMLLRGDADVNEDMGRIGLFWFFTGTSSTQEPRTVWLLLKNDARIFQGNTHGRMTAFQNLFFDKNSASMIPWDQLMNKEGGDWFLDDKLDGFNICYTGPDALAGLVSSIISAQVARIKSRCDLKQGSKFEIALEIAPVNTRVPVKWPLGTSVDDLLSYLQDPTAFDTRGIWEVDCRDATEECVVLLLLVVDDKTSPPASVVVEGAGTIRSICNSGVDGALSTQDASSRDSNERSDAILYWIQLGNQFGVDHKHDWRSLPPLLKAVRAQDINTTEMLGDADVNGANVIGNIALYWFHIGTSSTQEPRTVWLLLKKDAIIFRGNKHGPMPMVALQHMCLNVNMIPWYSSSLLKNQLMNKEDGGWLLDYELVYFNRCYTGPDAWYSARKALVIGLKRGNQMQPQCIRFVQSKREKSVVNAKDHKLGKIMDADDTVRRESLPAELQRANSHSLQFLPGICRMCVVPGSNGPATNVVHLPMLLQQKSESAKSESDYPYPVSSLTANITGDSHHVESRQLDLHSESNNVEIQQGNECTLTNVDSLQGGDSAKKDSFVIPIFVRHVSGELTLTVSLDQSLQHLMHLYTQKTKMKLEYQYFVYRRKPLEPDHSLLFYGIERDTTIHVCTRLLGGIVTMEEYLSSNKEKFLIEVTLPDGRVSLEMTKEGCLFLSTWLKCFTTAFADSKSWHGTFTLKDFKVVNGHVRVITSPNGKLTSSSMNADCVKLVQYIRAIFYKNKNLVSKFPPYLENLTTFLGSMKHPTLYPEDRLFIETHMCCVESTARGVFLVILRRKFKSLERTEQLIWERTMRLQDDQKRYASFLNLSNTAVFQDIIARARTTKKPYVETRASTMRLARDEYMHAPSHRYDKTAKPWREKFKNDDGIELMIPALAAYNPDLVPDIIFSLIRHKTIDIKSELLAVQVHCTCSICHPSHSGSMGGGESSTAGKGKQPADSTASTGSSTAGKGKQPAGATASTGFSQPASPVQAAPNPWFSKPSTILFKDAAKSSPTPQSSLSSPRFGSASSQDAKGKGKQHRR